MNTLRFAAITVLLSLPCLAHAADPVQASAASDTPAAAAASPAQAPPSSAASAASDAHASSAAAPVASGAAGPIAGGKIPGPPEGKGQVIFFRERKFVGAAITFKVHEGKTDYQQLSTGTYFVVPLDPGPHDFSVHTEAKDTLHMEIEAGETYFVQASISMGFMVGHATLTPSDQATFEKDLEKMTPAK